MKNTKENDLMILKQLYEGNHLNDFELERATKLILLLKRELKDKLK